jgi:hypothetical protein
MRHVSASADPSAAGPDESEAASATSCTAPLLLAPELFPASSTRREASSGSSAWPNTETCFGCSPEHALTDAVALDASSRRQTDLRICIGLAVRVGFLTALDL